MGACTIWMLVRYGVVRLWSFLLIDGGWVKWRMGQVMICLEVFHFVCSFLNLKYNWNGALC